MSEPGAAVSGRSDENEELEHGSAEDDEQQETDGEGRGGAHGNSDQVRRGPRLTVVTVPGGRSSSSASIVTGELATSPSSAAADRRS